MYGVLRPVNHVERRLEQEAGEHARGNNDPFRAVLRSQEVAHVELLIEQVLRAASADDIIVNAELPREVAFHAGIENGVGELSLDAASSHEAGAADHSVEMSEKDGEVGGGVGDEVAGEEFDVERMEFADVPLFAWGVGSDG